jgi:hypothetical protein
VEHACRLIPGQGQIIAEDPPEVNLVLHHHRHPDGSGGGKADEGGHIHPGELLPQVRRHGLERNSG